MKSLPEIKKEILEIELLSSDEISSLKPSVYKRLIKKLDTLRLLKTYLESSPSEDFVLKELSRLDAVIVSKMGEFDYDKLVEKGVPKKEISKLKKQHETKYDIGKMRTHVKNLRLLLK